MKRRRIFTIVLAFLLVLPVGALASDFSNIVVFGDSLSDNGNIFALNPASCPAEKYYQGRFSNGLVWVDYLAQADYLDATLINKAYGGAETTGDSPPGLKEQVTAYINAGTLPANALFIIWIGGNDFLGGSSDFEASADNVRDALDDLATFGAETILVLNLPDLGAIPRNNGDAAVSQVATGVTQGYNDALEDHVDAFETANPGITVYYLDIFTLFQSIVANPGNYDLTNVDAICPNFLVDNDFDNDDGYLFWDDIHPTTEAHEVIATKAKALVAPATDTDSDSSSNGCFVMSLAAH